MKLEKIKGIYEDVRNEGICSVVKDYIGEDKIEVIADYVTGFIDKHPKISEKAAPYLFIALTLADLVSKKDSDDGFF